MNRTVQPLDEILSRLELSNQDRIDLLWYITKYNKENDDLINLINKINIIENSILNLNNYINTELDKITLNIDNKLINTQTSINSINSSLNTFKTEINKKYNELKSHSDKTINDFYTSLLHMYEKVKNLENKTQNIDKYVSVDDFNTLLNKVNSLENTFNTFTKEINTSITTIKNNIESLNKNINAYYKEFLYFKNAIVNIIEDVVREQVGLVLSNEFEQLNIKIENVNNEINNINKLLNDSTRKSYISSIENKTLQMPNSVGGIPKGTRIEQLEGKTYSQLFDDLLFPTINPTFVNPSVSLSFKNYQSVVEIGSDLPTIDNFTKTYNPGSINLNGVKQNNRAGYLIEADSFIYHGGNVENKDLSTISSTEVSSASYKYRAYYQKGPQPKDNKGNNYNTPLAAGYVDSSVLTLYFVKPWFASTKGATNDTLIKQDLIKNAGSNTIVFTSSFTLQSSGVVNQKFVIPNIINIIQQYDPNTGQWSNVSINDWNQTTEVRNINGIDVTYYVYTYNGSPRGEVTLKISF